MTLWKKTIRVDDIKKAIFSTNKMRKGKEEKSQDKFGYNEKYKT